MYKSSQISGLLNWLTSAVSRILCTGVVQTVAVPAALAQAQSLNNDAAASHSSIRAQLIGSWRLVAPYFSVIHVDCYFCFSFDLYGGNGRRFDASPVGSGDALPARRTRRTENSPRLFGVDAPQPYVE